MPPFVRDLHLRVHTKDGETSVEAPPDVNTGKFLDDLREPLQLGHGIHIYDREGKRLDPKNTLGENGVGQGDDLYFRKEEETSSGRVPPPAPPPTPVGALKRCDNGHYYDPKKHSACPICDAGGRRR